jgi:Fic family protein
MDTRLQYYDSSTIHYQNYTTRFINVHPWWEDGEWVPWILYMLEAVEQTSLHTRDKIIAIRDLMDETLQYVKEKLPSRVYSKDLIEILFRQPYTKGQFLVDAGIAERKTAANYLKEIEKIGILKAQKLGKENLYLNVKLFELLSR